MSRYFFGALLGLFVLLVLSSTGSLLRIERGSTASQDEDDNRAVPTSPTSVTGELSDLERAGQLVIRQTSDEALEQIARQPDSEPTQTPATPTQPTEPAPPTLPRDNREAIPALW
ncbi:MAG: hypothetical protein AAFQ89_20965 [Cyanobacteria bacterium J06626_18]